MAQPGQQIGNKERRDVALLSLVRWALLRGESVGYVVDDVLKLFRVYDGSMAIALCLGLHFGA